MSRKFTIQVAIDGAERRQVVVSAETLHEALTTAAQVSLKAWTRTGARQEDFPSTRLRLVTGQEDPALLEQEDFLSRA